MTVGKVREVKAILIDASFQFDTTLYSISRIANKNRDRLREALSKRE